MKKPAEKSYLDRLKFDPKLLSTVVFKYITNIRIVILLALTISILGIFSYLNLPKRLNPEVKIPIVTVITTLPGASPQDMESLVSIPLENQLRSLKGLDTISSSSDENVSAITLQFLSNVDGDSAKKDVQSAVDSFTDLPDNAQKPKVTALDFEDQPIWTFAMIGKGDERSLMTLADGLKKKLTDLTKVDRVVLSGFNEQEVVISVDPEKVQQYGINPLLLSQTLKKELSSYPAGSVQNQSDQFAVTIDPLINKVSDIREMQLNIQGKVLKLSDIASVVEQTKLNEQQSFVAFPNTPPQRAVTFYVYKTTSSNIDEAGAQVQQAVDEYQHQYQNQFSTVTLVNTSEQINKQFGDLLREFRSTIILVFLCLFLFLGLRQALISSITVPLTFLSAFFFMQFFGMTINFLTLFAFLLALGLMVDDTIVTVSAMTTYYKTGKFTPQQTGLLVWRDTIVPIWSTTITTIWSFVPLLLSTGIIGEFIKPIPIVVTVTMLSSTAIAVLITLPIMIILLKPNIPKRVQMLGKIVLILLSAGILLAFLSKNPLLPIIGVLYIAFLFIFYRVFPSLVKKLGTAITQNRFAHRATQLIRRFMDHGIINIEGFSQAYYRTIIRILDSRSARIKVIVAIILYAVMSFMLLPLGLVKNEFFPKTDQDVFYVNVELPSGTPLQDTQKEADKLIGPLSQTPQTEFVIMEVGKSVNTQFSGSGGDTPNTVSYSFHLKPKESRTIQSPEIAQEVRNKFANYTAGTFSVVEQSGGPPAGADLQIKLLGDDLSKLDGYADKLVTYLKKQPGVTNADKSIKGGTSRLVFVPDYAKLADAGVPVDSVGLTLRTFASGFTLDSVNFDKSRTDKTDVVFKMENQNVNPSQLGSLSVTGANGTNYPLLSLGHFEARFNPTTITRENGKRTISVTASVVSGYSSVTLNKGLEKYADSLHLDSGYSWQTGGVNEENAKSVNSILQAMVFAFVLILITMVVQFGSFRQAMIVLIVIPLAVSSVFLLFALTDTPLSFPALIGVLSLFGIVVTNSMFIVDKINMNKRQGMKLKEAIADAGSSRLEPIILTKLCTVLGLLPITLADPLWRGLGGAIISGLLISSTIMLLFIPAVYYTLFQNSEK